jgi:hypothetical protein
MDASGVLAMNHYKPEWSRFVAKFKGHKVSLLDVKPFAAKAVRDGDENAASRWMRILYENNAKCWKQLLIRSVEDPPLGSVDTGQCSAGTAG